MVNSSPVTGQDALVPSFWGDEKTFGAACLASVLAASVAMAGVVGVAMNVRPARINAVKIDFMVNAPSCSWHQCQLILRYEFASPAPSTCRGRLAKFQGFTPSVYG